MGNSPLAGPGANGPHDQRDVERTESQGARPQETKTEIVEAPDSRTPQWRPTAGPEDLRRVAERPVVDGWTTERTMYPEATKSTPIVRQPTKSTPTVRQTGWWDDMYWPVYEVSNSF